MSCKTRKVLKTKLGEKSAENVIVGDGVGLVERREKIIVDKWHSMIILIGYKLS
jgi:hypothetical protein